MGRYEDAIKVFSQSIARKPTDQAYSNLGTCYYFLGRYSEAADAYQKAIRITPKQYIYWANLADAQRWIPGSDAKASAAYEEAINLERDELALNPTDVSVRARLAECLAKHGNYKDAQTEISRALAADSTTPVILYRAAIVANAAGKPGEAGQWLTRAFAQGYPRADFERDPEFALLRSRGNLQ
jgi:serine/threonine-protein kinase